MKVEATPANRVLELLSVREAARELKASDVTLARKIEQHGVVPDAVLLLGTTRRRSPLFVTGRLNELKALLPR